MDEYISREAALKKIQMQLLDLEADQDKGEYSELCENRGARDALDEAIYDIRTLKAADVQPVKHGRWVSEKVRKPDWKGVEHDYFQPNSCSVCHTGFAVRSNFCPHCGARLDGDSE